MTFAIVMFIVYLCIIMGGCFAVAIYPTLQSSYWWNTYLFRFLIGRRADMWGEPIGFLLMWRPRPWECTTRYQPIPCSWQFGIWFLSRADAGSLQYQHNWGNLLPRVQWSHG